MAGLNIGRVHFDRDRSHQHFQRDHQTQAFLFPEQGALQARHRAGTQTHVTANLQVRMRLQTNSFTALAQERPDLILRQWERLAM